MRTNTNWSVTQIERILAAFCVMEATEAFAEEAAGKRTELRRELDECEAELFGAIAEAKKEHGGNPWPTNATHAICSRRDEQERVDAQFQAADREARSLADQHKKLRERVLQLVADASEGEDLYTKRDAKPPVDAWRSVQIADLIGDLQARGFATAGLGTVGQFVDAYRAGVPKATEDVTREQLAHAAAAVNIFVDRRGVKDEMPKALVKAGAALHAAPIAKEAAKAPLPAGHTIGGAAAALGCNQARIRELVAEGRLRMLKDNAGAEYIEAAGVEAMIDDAQDAESRAKLAKAIGAKPRLVGAD